MEAAAHGKSTLHIPVSVGKDFVAADRRKAKRMPAVMDSIVKGK